MTKKILEKGTGDGSVLLFQRTWVLVPDTHKVAHNHLSLQLQRIQHCFLPPWVSGRQVVHINMQAKHSCTHNNILKSLKRILEKEVQHDKEEGGFEKRVWPLLHLGLTGCPSTAVCYLALRIRGHNLIYYAPLYSVQYLVYTELKEYWMDM